MRNVTIFSGILVACAGCVAPPPPPLVTSASMSISPTDPACRDYTAQVVIDAKPETVVGHACRQADGSWRGTEGVAGRPQQLVEVGPPDDPVDPYDPWLWGPPIGFSLGTSIFIDHRFGHHFHHGGGFAFHHHFHGGFAHGGFHHG